MEPRASYKCCSDSRRGPSPFRVDYGNFVAYTPNAVMRSRAEAGAIADYSQWLGPRVSDYDEGRLRESNCRGQCAVRYVDGGDVRRKSG